METMSQPTIQNRGRRAGLLLHPTAFPGGTLVEGYQWIDFIKQCGFSVWQMLPLTIPFDGLSPYQSISAFAINPCLLTTYPDYNPEQSEYQKFCDQNHFWLPDFAYYHLLKDLHAGAAWFQWPAPFKKRHKRALQLLSDQHYNELETIKWQQFQLYRHWQKLRRYAADRSIELFGDMPIFVAHDSADVWANPDLFLLDKEGEPTVVAGVPPDYFSATGQRWGNPHYNWRTMQRRKFSWWIERLRYAHQFFDLIRIDHFRGLEAVWQIDCESETAIDGTWVKVPGRELLKTVSETLGELPLVAEDLGLITPEVIQLKNDFNLPGMSVLQFAFDEMSDNPHKPENVTPNSIYYTGTHDNNTVLGWFQDLAPDTQSYVCQKLEIEDCEIGLHEVGEKMISTILESRADLAIIPLQDLLFLGSEARFNTPGTVSGNWGWKFSWDKLRQPELASTIHQWLEESSRLNSRL